MLKCQQQTLHRFHSLIGIPCRRISAPNSATQAWMPVIYEAAGNQSPEESLDHVRRYLLD